jgi:hypothetical protein
MKKETNEKNLLWAQTTQSHHLGLGDVALLGVIGRHHPSLLVV